MRKGEGMKGSEFEGNTDGHFDFKSQKKKKKGGQMFERT